jgi:hypothetical protein
VELIKREVRHVDLKESTCLNQELEILRSKQEISDRPLCTGIPLPAKPVEREYELA